jgi:ketosteroid isomerase-like protein
MVDSNVVSAWVNAYRKAWESNEPDDIRALFTEDAVYRTEPYEDDAWRGHDEIVAGWLDGRDEPGDTEFTWSPLVSEGDIATVTGVTHYDDATYSNLWVIRFTEDGRASEFTEWYMTHPEDE